MEFKFANGDRVRDTLTGFTGIVVCRSDWFNGCLRYAVQGDKLNEGVPTENQHFDEAQLELRKAGAVKMPQVERGGPQPAPKRPRFPANSRGR